MTGIASLFSVHTSRSAALSGIEEFALLARKAV